MGRKTNHIKEYLTPKETNLIWKSKSDGFRIKIRKDRYVKWNAIKNEERTSRFSQKNIAFHLNLRIITGEKSWRNEKKWIVQKKIRIKEEFAIIHWDE